MADTGEKDERISGNMRMASGQAEVGLRSRTAGAHKGRPYKPVTARNGRVLSRKTDDLPVFVTSLLIYADFSGKTTGKFV